MTTSFYYMSYDDADKDYNYGAATLEIYEFVLSLIPIANLLQAEALGAKTINGIASVGMAALNFTDTISIPPAREGAYYKFEVIIDSTTVINGRIGPGTQGNNKLNSINTEFYQNE